MLKSKRYFQLFISTVVVLILLGCISPNNPQPESTQTLANVNSVPPTPYPTPLRMEDAYATASEPNYLLECLNISTKQSTKPIGYKGIIPGQTSANDVRNLVGNPLYITDILHEWTYAGFNIDFKKDTVSWISVFADVNLMTPLKVVLKKYGCPEIIIAFDPNEDDMGVLGGTSFIYPSGGVEFQFFNYPVSLNEISSGVNFFVASSLYEYLKDRSVPFGGTVQIVTWEEAVIK